jgi:outer membrane protein assembly factor BamB
MAGTMWGPAALRRRWLVFTLTGTLLLPAAAEFAGSAERNTGPPRSPPAQAQSPPVASAVSADSPLCSPSEDGWHPNLLRERQLELRLRSARKHLAEQNYSGALTDLQFVLDLPDDIFVRVEWEPVPRGACDTARRLFDDLPPAALRTYESLWGSEARNLLAEARQSRDAALYAQTLRRFFHTAAGFEAADWLAAREMDHGRFALAASLWSQLLGTPAHRQRVRPMHRLRAAFCLRMIGDTAAARKLIQQLGGEGIRISGRDLAPEEWLEQAVQSGRRLLAARGNFVVCGGPCRNGVASGTVPALVRPAWSASLAGSRSEHIHTLAAANESYQLQQGTPLGAAHFPLVVGTRLVFRDYEGIRAIDLATGTTLWRHECGTSLVQRIPTPGQPLSEGSPPDPQNHLHFMTGNALLGMLSSDGRAVFAVDQLDSGERPGASRHDGSASIPPHTNRLIALQLAPETESAGGTTRLAWEVGGPADDPEAAQRLLTGHFFLGPPLATEDRLYAVSECDQQLHVSCLEPATGRVIWMQVICAVPQPIGLDQQRMLLDCSPALSEGTLVVPTQAGLLVALDPLTGALRWGSSCDDAQLMQRQQSSSWPYSMRTRYGHLGYPSPPVIDAGHAILLPVHSEYIHAVDLQTGSVVWRARRGDLEAATAGEYVAAVTDRTVLMVGRRRCRGLSLNTGEETWSVRLGSTPAGRGVCTSAGYLVPCDDGQILAFDPDTGRQTGWSRAIDGTRLGNLLLGGDLVVSMGRTDVTAFPQAGPLLEQLLADGSDRLTPAQVLDAAELELALGRTATARDRLKELRTAKLPAELATRAEGLYRDTLLAELSAGSKHESRVLADLEPLMNTPAQRARLCLERGRAVQDDPAIALAAARELSSLSLEHPLAITDDPSRSVAGTAAARGLLSAALSGENQKPPQRLDSVVDDELSQILASKDLAALRRFTRLYADWPQADRTRLRLAEVAVEQQRNQLAELVLLDARNSEDAATRGASTRLLAELWSSRDRHADAALLLEELATRYAAVEVAPGQNGTGYVEHFPHDSPTWAEYRRFEAPQWALAAAKISTQPAANDQLQNLSGNGVTSVPTPRHLSLQLLDQGRGSSALITMLDRRTGTMYPETIDIPGRLSHPATFKMGSIQHSFVGHFFAVGTSGTVRGISLLDRRIVWQTTPPGARNTNDLVRVGPAGPGYAAFQYRQNLFVLDPADGRLLWHRNDLEGNSGLMHDPWDGIIGDEKVLVVFHGSRGHYTTYDTATGAEIRRGRLDANPRHTRAFGRLFVHFSGTADDRRLRVWDPLGDRLVFDMPAGSILDMSSSGGHAPGTKVLSCVRDADELVYVTIEGRLQVIDVASGAMKFDIPLDETQFANLNKVEAFHDRENYYFSLQHPHVASVKHEAAGEASNRERPAPLPERSLDSCVAALNVEAGDLLAVDRATGRLLWSHAHGRRSVLHFPRLRLPVLLLGCQLGVGEQSVSLLEVLDVRTGEIVVRRDDLPNEKLLHMECETDPGRIVLRGGKVDYCIDFGTNLARAGR